MHEIDYAEPSTPRKWRLLYLVDDRGESAPACYSTEAEATAKAFELTRSGSRFYFRVAERAGDDLPVIDAPEPLYPAP